MARDLDINITVKGAVEAKRDLGGVDTSLKNIEKSGKKAETDGLTPVEGALRKIGAAVGGIKAVEIAVNNASNVAKASVAAYSEQENAIVKLTTALKAQGQSTPAVIASYQVMASQFQRTTVNADELINQMQALLTQVGNVMPNQMRAALKAATDLSAGLGIDLRTATMLVGKAFEGETGTLKRYGIVIDEAKLKTDGASAVMDAINQKFGGQAQAQMETYTGKVANLSNRMNDFQERVGSLLVRALTPLLDIFEAMPDSMQTVVFAIGAVTAVLGPLGIGLAGLTYAFGAGGLGVALVAAKAGFVAFTTFVSGTVIPLIGTALPIAFRGLMVLLTPPAGLVIAGILAVVAVWRNWDAITGIVKAVYDAVKEWLVDKFAAVVNFIGEKVDAVTGFFRDMYDKVVGHSYIPDLLKGIQREFGRLDGAMVSPARAAINIVTNMFRTFASDVLDPIIAKMGKAGQMAVGIGSGIAGGVGGQVGGATGAMVGTIASTVGGAVVGGAMGAAATASIAGAVALGAATAGIGLAAVGAYWALKKVFTVSKEEKEARVAIGQFNDTLVQTATEAQRAEAAMSGWEDTGLAEALIVVRDSYVAAGHSAEEAQLMMGKFWDSSHNGGKDTLALQQQINAVVAEGQKIMAERQAVELAKGDEIHAVATARLAEMGQALDAMMSRRDQLMAGIAKEAPERVRGVIETRARAELVTLDKEIANQRAAMKSVSEQAAKDLEKLLSGINPTVNVKVRWQIPPLPQASMNPSSFHQGGVIRAHNGLAMDEVPIIAQTGEGILNRGAMRRLGGASTLNRVNAGGAMEPGTARAMASLQRSFDRLRDDLLLSVPSANAKALAGELAKRGR